VILICDDEKNIRRTLAMVLEGEGYHVQVSARAAEALMLLSDTAFDAVLLDVQLPDFSGIEALRRIRESESPPEVIMISGHASLQDAVEATRLGAFDFLEKPIDRERLLITLRNALERHELKIRVRDLAERDNPVGIIGDSQPMRHLLSEIQGNKTKARVDHKSGRQKVVARAIHRLVRTEQPRKVNCAAMPADLIERAVRP
jgi:DNA-binding NtrC family response regulator